AHEFGDLLSRALLAAPPVRKERGTRSRTGMRAALAAAALVLTLLGVWMYPGRGAGSQSIPAATAAAVAPVPAPAHKPEATQKPDGGPADASGDRLFWSSISASDDPRAFREYLAKYPRGEFASLAKLKLQPQAAAQKAEPAGPHPGPGAVSKAVTP